MADFNTPTQLSSGKWIYQGEEHDTNPLNNGATTKPVAKQKAITKKKKDPIAEAYGQAQNKQQKYSGGLASMLGL